MNVSIFPLSSALQASSTARGKKGQQSKGVRPPAEPSFNKLSRNPLCLLLPLTTGLNFIPHLLRVSRELGS